MQKNQKPALIMHLAKISACLLFARQTGYLYYKLWNFFQVLLFIH